MFDGFLKNTTHFIVTRDNPYATCVTSFFTVQGRVQFAHAPTSLFANPHTSRWKGVGSRAWAPPTHSKQTRAAVVNALRETQQHMEYEQLINSLALALSRRARAREI